MLVAHRAPVLVFALVLTVAGSGFAQEASSGTSASEAATEVPKVGVRPFASKGRRAKAAAAAVEKAFADAWKEERSDDQFLGGRAPKYQRKEALRAKNAAALAQKEGLTHIVDATITKRRSKVTVELMLIGAAGDIVQTEKVVTRKVKKAAFAKVAKALAAKIPEPPPPPPPPPPKEEEPEVAAASDETPQAEEVAAAAAASESEATASGGGGFGSVLAGSGLFFLGSGVTALAAGAAFTAGAILGRDWENKATLSSGLREEVNTAIFWTSVSADVVLAAGIVTTLAGVGLLTTGLLIE